MSKTDPAFSVSKKSAARFKIGFVLFLIITIPAILYFAYGWAVPNHSRAIEGMDKWVSDMIPLDVYEIHNKGCKEGDRDGDGKVSCHVAALNKVDTCDLKMYQLQCTSTWWWQDWISEGCSGGSSKDN